MRPGDRFYVGLRNGPLGRAAILADDADGMQLAIEWEGTVQPSQPVTVLAGLPRPQTARRILFESAVFGVQQLIFFQAEKGEPSYAQSKLWAGEWERHLQSGAEQAFSTTIPEIQHHRSLSAALAALPLNENHCLALDVYEGSLRLADGAAGASSLCLGLGPERGWSAAERDHLRQAGFQLASLGERVLRTESALVAGLAVALAAMQRI